MNQHAGRIGLFSSQNAMLHRGGGRAGIAVFIGRLGYGQTFDQVVNQPGKVPSALLIGELKAVEFGRLLASRQPICD